MRGRTRVLAGFAAFGALWGAWGAALPAMQDGTGASDAELGLALLLVGAGALASMRAVGALIDRRGGVMTAWTVAALGISAALPGLARSPVQLAGGMLVLGAASGAADVAINAEGVREEKVSGRPVLNLAHAAFSVAVVVASLTAGALRGAGAGAAAVLAFAGLALLVAAGGLAAGPPQRLEPVREGSRTRLGTPGWLLLLGAMCALAYWVENAWQSWSAVHLQRDLGAAAAVSSFGPAAFASAAAAGRLAGQRLVAVLGDRALIAAGATVAAAGTTVAALAPGVPLGVAGILLAGAGTSVCAPTIISLAGAAARPEQRGAAVSTVTTIAYLGFLVGPPVVGGVAALTSLRASLTAVAALALALALITTLAHLPRR
jgi:predicted MFS family arabinose efflux permease